MLCYANWAQTVVEVDKAAHIMLVCLYSATPELETTHGHAVVWLA